jgi:hypothetical protein
MKFTKMVLAASLIAGASFANASETKLGIQGGYASGGDTLATINFTDGSSETLKAGSGILIGVFTIAPLSDNGVALKLAANYLNDSVTATNGEVTFTRLPIDALVLKQMNKWQVAAGLTYHLNPQYKSTFDSNEKIDADNALGLLLEANYQVYSKGEDSLSINIGARYTNIEYTFDGVTKSYDGSNLAITAGITF